MFTFKNNKVHWPRRDLIMFLERLELYVSAGLSMNKALDAIASGATKKQKTVVQALAGDIESGSALSRALSTRVKISSTISGLLSHGETSGKLASSIALAKQLLEREDELIKKCVGAMLYPTVIGIFSLVLVIALMKGVMPQIVPMLRSLHVALPLPTRFFMALSDYIGKYGLWTLLGAIFGGLISYAIYQKSRMLQSALQVSISKVPIVGQLSYLYFSSVFIRSMGSLVESGVPISTAYVNAVQAISFIPLKRVSTIHMGVIERGVTLGSVLGKMRRMPAFVSSLVTAGEATGSLGASLIHAASILDRDIEYSLKKLTSLIEPLMMAGMGGIVGSIALSIIMPIYDVSKALQH